MKPFYISIIIVYISFLCPQSWGGEALSQGESYEYPGCTGASVCTYSYQVIPMTYDRVSRFENGLSSVSKGGMEGVINTKGQVVLPIEYHSVSISNHLITATNNLGEKLFFQKDGQPSDIGQKYDEVLPWSNFAKVRQGDQWGIIDLGSGTPVVPVRYDHRVRIFWGNLGMFQKGNQWSIVDLKRPAFITPLPMGIEVIDMNLIQRRDEGLTVLLRTADDKSGIIRTVNGKVEFITSFEYDEIITSFESFEYDEIKSSGFNNTNAFFLRKGQKWGAMRLTDGQIFIPLEYDYLKLFRGHKNHKLFFRGHNNENSEREPLIFAVKDGKGGLLNGRSGEPHTPMNFDSRITNQEKTRRYVGYGYENSAIMISDFFTEIEFGFSVVRRDGKRGLLKESTGQLVVPTEYKVVRAVSENIAILQKEGESRKLFDISTLNPTQIEIEFDGIRFNSKWNLFIRTRLEPNGKGYGKRFQDLLDINFKPVTPVYRQIYLKDDGFVVVSVESQGGRFLEGVLNTNFEPILPMDDYSYIQIHSGNLIAAQKGHRWQLFNGKGSPLTELEFTNVFQLNWSWSYGSRIENLLRVKKGYKSGVVSVDKGVVSYVIPIEYDSIRLVKNKNTRKGLFLVRDRYQNGLRTMGGQPITEVEFDEIRVHESKTAPPLFQVRKGNDWGILDANGQTLVPVEFDEVSVRRSYNYYGKEGRGELLTPVPVRRGNHWGFVEPITVEAELETSDQ